MSASVSAATPPVSRRAVWLRIGLFGGAAVFGLVLNHFVQHHLATLQAFAASDPIAARRQLAWEIRIGGLCVFGVVVALGAAIVPMALRAARAERFPPPGMWSIGTTRVVTGPAARAASRIVAVLGALLIVCAAAGGWLSWEMGTRLIACRAGVPAASTPH